jgi:serine/threonine protein kinase
MELAPFGVGLPLVEPGFVQSLGGFGTLVTSPHVTQRKYKTFSNGDTHTIMVSVAHFVPTGVGTRVVRVPGRGGNSVSAPRHDTDVDRTVAITVTPLDVAADRPFRARFHREARAISQLQHPHICTLYDIGDMDGTAFLVMEVLQGANPR